MDVMKLLEEQVERLIREHRRSHAEGLQLKRENRQLQERLRQATEQLQEKQQELAASREQLAKSPDPARVDEARKRIESLLLELEGSSDPEGGSYI